MKVSRRLLIALGLFAASSGCSQQTVSVQLHPLQSSGDVSFNCRVDTDPNGMLPSGEGRPLDECNPASVSRGERNLFALVTQMITGEVALLNVPLDPAHLQPGEGFVDVANSVPGYGFIHVGAEPGHIVTTPGGYASFVGVGEVGKPGIYGLPTSCLSRPGETEYERDITTWPACSLPAVPGAMVVAVDPPVAPPDDVARSCDRSRGLEVFEHESTNSECPAELTVEGGPKGRRKLLVALPDLGSIAVIDAQSLLNRAPGSFEPCEIELTVPLNVTPPVTPPVQDIPDDLRECGPNPVPTPTPPEAFHATPSDFDLSEGKLYVADATAPFIHILNAEQPCTLTEGSPLLPHSLDNQNRIVTTSKVAVSPLAPSGRRFAYAIDQYDQPNPTIMMFDVSPGSTNPTPIVRPRARYLPFEAADRIQFTGAPRDVSFVLRDRPDVDPITGNVVVGTSCEPDPSKSDSAGARYRAASDYSSGARPSELRGLFASVALTGGQVAMVDVEDFDAPCRRTRSTNTADTEDFRGCRADPEVAGGVYQCPPDSSDCNPGPGLATVTDEVSCRMVEPHRQRASSLGRTDGTLGIHAPSLRAFPQIKVPDGAAQGNLKTWPKLLAVPFAGVGPDANPAEGVPAEVFINTTLYNSSATGTNALRIKPKEADTYSLTLPYNEPRAYPTTNDLSLVYEGSLLGTAPDGSINVLKFGFVETPQEDPSLAAGTMRLRDTSQGFCDLGVSDPEVMREYGERRFGLAGEPLETFAQEHSDYVVITADFPASDDPYWRAVPLECGRTRCETLFGRVDAKQLSSARDFKIMDADQHNLLLTPRDPKDDVARVEALSCCFPSGIEYSVRASKQWVLRGHVSGFRHQVVADKDTFNCKRDCNPRKHFFESRVFEISQKACGGDDCRVGIAPAGQKYCVANDGEDGVKLNEPAASCILETVTDRLVVYAGPDPSLRDMAFSWQVVGGFFAQRVDLTGLSVLTSPRTLVDLPQFSWLILIDGGALGLVQISMDSLGPLIPPLN